MSNPIPPIACIAKRHMRQTASGLKKGIFLIILQFFSSDILSQTTLAFDLSASKDTVVTTASIGRSGSACAGSNCVKFDITLNPGTDLLELAIVEGAVPGGALFYQINCDPTQYSMETPVCISGMTTVSITFCKPGGNNNKYQITASAAVKGSADLTLRENCSGTMSVAGLTAGSITWKSIFPGAAGLYNSYLTCNPGCTSVTVTPQVGSPPYIDYEVSGSTSCAGLKSDIVRVYTTPALSIPITPANPAICSGASTNLTATPSGGLAPYTYLWSSGQTVSTISTAVTGTFTVTVNDATTGCAPISVSTIVTAAATPAAPTASGTTICAGGTATLAATAPGGTYRWYDVSSGGTPRQTGASFTTPVLNSTTTYYVETTVSSCPSPRTAVTVTVTPLPAAPTVSGATICAGNATTLTATAPGGIYNWYSDLSGGTLLQTGTSYATPVLNTGATYYVDATVSSCAGPRTAVVVTVTPLSAAPTANGATICAGNTITLTATAPGNTYQWYDAASGGTLLQTGAIFITPVLSSNATYYVQSDQTGCVGSRTAVAVTVSSIPSAPVASGASICNGTSTTLTATAPGGSYRWYDASGGGTLLSSTASYTTSALGNTTTYYVESTIASCTGPRTAVVVNVAPFVVAPTVSNATVCAGNTTSLTANAPAGTLQWYSAASGGTLLNTGSVYTTPALSSSITYYVEAEIAGCSSVRTAVTVTVNPIPAAPSAAGNTICAGNATVVTASGSSGAYQWYDAATGGNQLVSAGTYTTPVLTANATYYVQAISAGCASSRTAAVVTVNAIPAAPTVNPAAVCVGTSTTVTAIAPGGVYKWYDAPSGGNLLASSANYSTPVLNATTNYYVETSISSCTSSRTAVTVSVAASLPAPTVANTIICTGTAATLIATAPGGTYQWYDAASGGTLLGTGSAFTTPLLSSAATFFVEANVSGCTGPRATVSVNVSSIPAAPTAASTSICTGSSAALAATDPGGTYQWYDAAFGGNLLSSLANYNTPVLSANTNYYVQATVAGCAGSRTAVTVSVNSKPLPPAANGVSVCAGNTATVLATSGAGGYQWYDALTGGNLLSSNSNYTSPVLSANAIYYAETIVNGCSSDRTAVPVTVNPIPAMPAVASANICTGSSATLTAGPAFGVTYQWYDAPNGGNLLASGLTYTTPTLSNNVFYHIEAVASGCASSRTSVLVSVNAAPAAPTVAGSTICAGRETSLTATAPGGSYEWFDAASGGNLLTSNANLITPVLNATTTYYVQTTVGGCTGTRTAVNVTVNPAPPSPTAASAAICAGNAVTLSAGGTGGIYQWYDAVTGGNLLVTNSVFATPVLATSTTYYVQTTVAACASARTPVTVAVTSIPIAPTATAPAVCEGTASTLSATAPGGSYEWFDAPTGGNLLANTANYTTPVLTATSGFYLQSTINGCVSPRSQIMVTVIPIQNPAFNYASGTFCVTGTNPVPVILGSGGVFSASPAGLVFTNNATGEIDLAASALGTYIVKMVISGACVYASTANVTITTSPDASFSYNGPYCQLQPAAAATFVSGASAGVFSASPAGLNFVSTSTGMINLNTSAAGTYTVINNIPALGGCAAVSATGIVVVNPSPAVSAGSDQTVCAGTTVTLSGTISGSATAATWSGGLGTFSSNTTLTTQYTPAPGELKAKLYLTTDDPSGPCDAIKDSVTIFINTIPAAPVALGASVCTGTSTTLVASTSGGMYEWFTNASGGSPVQTAQVFTTPALTSQTTYYVQSTVNGCTGPRKAVTVLVNLKPNITSPAAGAICSGSPVNYTFSSDIAGTNYTWSRSTNTGISNPAATGSGTGISEVLNNQTASSTAIAYVIVPENNGCEGPAFNYLVTVNPTPQVPVLSSSSPTCVGTPLYLSTNAISGASYSWTGPNGFTSVLQNPVITDITSASAGNYSLRITVNGCTSQAATKNIFPVIAIPVAASNGAVCEGGTIQLSAGNLVGASYFWSGPGGYSSVQQNPSLPSAKPSDAGVYYVTASISGCAGLTDSTKVIVNTPPTTPSILGGNQVCVGDSLALTANTISGASYQWAGPGGFSSSAPTVTISKAAQANGGVYVVTVSTMGCSLTESAKAAVVVSPKPATPLATSNSPVCEGGTLSLFTPTTPGLVYNWTNASGFTSSFQGPAISNVMTVHAGTYSVTVSANGCSSAAGTTIVSVIKPAVVDAGGDQTVCGNNAVVKLNGNLTGDDTKAIAWSGDGTGTFGSKTSLITTYTPSAADTARGTVALKLSTTNNRACAVSTSSLTVTITDAPTANAGADIVVCANDSLIALNGIVSNAGTLNWSTKGLGTFNASTGNANLIYTPGKQDILNGTLLFYLSATGNRLCSAAIDTVKATILPTPYVNAGADRIIFENDTLVFAPDVRGSNLQYFWLPFTDISSNTIKNPVLTGKESRSYKLRVTGQGGCVAQDEVLITVLKPIEIPNVFSPNGDGVHDTWEIKQLSTYPGATVEIFTRSGQRIFYAEGYYKPWDGTYNGKPVPLATYYYIINPKLIKKIFSGSVTVLR